MKEQFKNYMQTFNVHDVYRALLVDRHPEALRHLQMSIDSQSTKESDTQIRVEKIEDLIYNLSDSFMSVEPDYFKVYTNPISKKIFNQLIILKVLASLVRKLKSNQITQKLLDQLFPGLTIDLLVKQFKGSDLVKIKPEADSFTIDLGPYFRIYTEGSGCIKYNVDEKIINKTYDIINSMSPAAENQLNQLANQLCKV